MRSDSEIKRDVEDELRWDPESIRRYCGSSQERGRHLDRVRSDYAQKLAAERSAKRVAGVVGVANDLEVRIPMRTKDPILKSRATSLQT